MRESRHRLGATLFETLVVLAVAAMALAIAVPRFQLALDRLSVRSAAVDLRATLHSARWSALSSQAAVAVHLDDAAGTVKVLRSGRQLLSRNLASAHGVVLGATRDSLAFGPMGLGRGAANLSIILRRRAAAETVFVSRLGRIR